MLLQLDSSEGSVSYVISVPDLPGCLTAGHTIAEAVKNAEDAKENWLLAALEDGYAIPEPESYKALAGKS